MRHAVFILTTTMALIANAAVAQDARDGDWSYSRQLDDFTDEDRSFVFTPDEDGSDAALSFRCMSDGLNVVYLLGGYMGGDRNDRIRVRHRIDQNDPTDRYDWGLMQGSRAAWMPMGRVPSFRADAERGGSVVFEAVDPLDGESRRHRFSLSGLRTALARLPCATNR